MKKSKKLLAALLAACMLLSLTPTTLALTDDSTECPYCGIGMYIYNEPVFDPTPFFDNIDERVCIHYGAPYIDKLIQRTDFVKSYCTNSSCSMSAPVYTPRYTRYWDCWRYGGTGMSIDGEVS